MSDAPSARGDEPRLLAPLTVAVLLAVGITCFLVMLLLGAYAPDLGRRGGGGHALSNAVHGFGGLVRLAEATGRHPRIVRNAHLLSTDDLLIATPESGAVSVGPVMDGRATKTTLIILPKWDTSAHHDHDGWAYVTGLKDRSGPAAVLAPAAVLDIVQLRSGGRPLRMVDASMMGIAFAAPRPLQAIRPAPAKVDLAKGYAYGRLRPLIVDEAGDIVLGRFPGRQLYVLADPDLLDNRGMRDARTAASALALLDWINDTGAKGIAFDVTLNGLGHGASPLRLLFEPPFLAMTLSLAAAVLLAALGTVARFGSPRPRERAIAFGKAALVDNAAALVRRAGREARLGGRYAEVIREAAIRAFGVPARLRGAGVDAYLDRLGRGRPFTSFANAATEAASKAALVGAARALHDWKEARGR